MALVLTPGASNAEPIKLTLQDALKLAEQNDIGLKSAHIETESADALIKEATSGALPSVNFNAATGRYVIAPTSSIPAFGPGKIRFTPVNDASMGITILQPIWLGGRVGLALDAAKLYGRLSRESIKATRANLKKQIIQDYFRCTLALEVLAVTKETLDQASNHALKASQMYDVGVASEFDLLRAQTEARSLEPELYRARQGAELAKMNLRNILGLSADTEMTLTDSLESSSSLPMDADFEELFQKAKSLRPEFTVMDLQKSLNIIGLQAEQRSLYWPNVNFSLVYQTSIQDDHYANMSPSQWSTSLRWGLSVNIPLFNGFATDARVEKARLGIRRTELARSGLENGLRLEVTAALTEYRRASDLAAGQEEVLELAGRAYSIALVRYEQGLGTELEVQDARLALSRARIGHLQGLYDLRIAVAEVARAIENDSELNSGNAK